MTLDSITSHVHLVIEVAMEKLSRTRSHCVQGLFCRERAPDKHEILLKEEVSVRDMKGRNCRQSCVED